MSHKSDTLVAALAGVAIVEIAAAVIVYVAVREAAVEGVNIVNVPLVNTITLKSGSAEGVSVRPGPKTTKTLSNAPYIVGGVGVVGFLLTLLFLSED